MRLGIFGGTFDPIHLGHLRAAEELSHQFRLERVLFIPCGMPPHKDPKDVTAAAIRKKMVAIAIRGNPRFKMSDMELRRPGKSYSIDTLRELTHIHGGGKDLYFLIGYDEFKKITSWKEYSDLFSLSNFVVATRPGYEEGPGPRSLAYEVAQRLTELLSDPRVPGEVRNIAFDTVFSLTEGMEGSRSIARSDSLLVAEHAASLGRAMGLSSEDCDLLKCCGVLCDLGTVGKEEGTRARARLTPSQAEGLREHPVIGAQVMSLVPGLKRASPWVQYHHEYYDGSGYPDGLKGEEIPIHSRILLVAAAYVAMTREGPYRFAMEPGQAIEELKRNSGKQFDPKVVDVFISSVLRRGPDGRLPLELAGHFYYDWVERRYVHPSGHVLHFATVTLMDISSSKIREAVREGGSLKYLVPPGVEEFISREGLYREQVRKSP